MLENLRFMFSFLLSDDLDRPTFATVLGRVRVILPDARKFRVGLSKLRRAAVGADSLR
jgi:hypothetical protein